MDKKTNKIKLILFINFVIAATSFSAPILENVRIMFKINNSISIDSSLGSSDLKLDVVGQDPNAFLSLELEKKGLLKDSKALYKKKERYLWQKPSIYEPITIIFSGDKFEGTHEMLLIINYN